MQLMAQGLLSQLLKPAHHAARWVQLPRLGSCLHATAIERDRRFAQLNDADVQHFRDLLGDAGVVTDATALDAHNRDWMNKYQGHSKLVLRPSSTEQVSKVLSYCSQRQLAVVPQGGNTGLVGGSVPVFDEVVLHLGRMNKILSFDKVSGTLVCEAGCVLATLDAHTWPQGWIMPLDLGAKGSCHIGGNVSTNAGGIRLLRYGSLHGSVLGVEAVLGDGRVLDVLKTLRKDNTGYDLKQLFIGAEGTLGVVTKVSIQCAPRPASVNVVFFSLTSFTAVTQLLTAARLQLGEVLSAFEFLDSEAMRNVCEFLPGVVHPLPNSGSSGQPPQPSATTQEPFYVLIETHGSNNSHDTEKLQAFLESVMESGMVVDGVMAESESQAASLWRVREGVAESLGRRGAVYKYDVSVPTTTMYDLVEDMRTRLRPWGSDVRVVGYGHVGDGNLHLNVSAPSWSPELEAAIEPYIYERVAACQGSVSAEHGLGRQKAKCVGYSKPPLAVEIMGQLKRIFDPAGILNPYKVLPTAQT